MADYTVIGDVSAIIVRTLTAAFADLQPVPPVVELNDLSDAVQTPVPKLTVFLYDIAEDPASRNRPPIRSQPPEPATVRKPPMALLLRYLLTPWGGSQVTQHQMIGRTLQALYDDAILDGGQLTGSLAGSTDALHVTLTPLTLDQKSWVWYAIQKPYRLSLNYEVRVVNLDALSAAPVSPVTGRLLAPAAHRPGGPTTTLEPAP
jgi:Pvc16 N-terminal domain